jgi:plastocyanin
MRPRKLVMLVAVMVLAIGSVAIASTGPAAGSPPGRTHEPLRVQILGAETFEANTLIQATFRFSPGQLYPHSGDHVRWVDADQAEEPHTVTIVRRAQLPMTADEVFSCRPCRDALRAHFGTDPPTLRVNVGPAGLDQPGDSLLLLPGGSIGAAISAPAGTKLSYVCAIHPWMQGRIVVG